MEEPIATLERNDAHRDSRRVMEPGAAEPRGGTMKFAYASGSRPLDGYTIKRGIGRGGFGEVYFATSDGGKEVALKLIRRNLDVELRGVSHCLNLKHVNLIGLYDIKRDVQEDAWVVMEYVSGECLDAVIARHPQGMPVNELLEWIRGIGAGVAYLHDKRVVHRDLKPGNIFSDEGLVKIGDYGLSKFISASRRSGQTGSVGTVHYMAPEVANGRYGKEIDIYALGIMLYEMLTGHVPFEGESIGEVLMKHLTAEPDTSVLAEPYRGIVAKALAKDPERRFKSVAEMLALLPTAAGASPGGFSLPTRPIVVPMHSVPVRSPAAAVAVVEEEPLWRAMREAWQQLRDAWTRANFSTPTKVVLIVVGIFVMVQTGAITIPAIMCGALFYGGYRVVRAMLLTRAGGTPVRPVVTAPMPMPPPVMPIQSGKPPLPVVAPPAAHACRRSERLAQHRREQALPAMLVKSGREKATELLGSLLVSSFVAVILCLVMSLILKDRVRPAQFAWLAIVGTVGSWAVLIPAKRWEGTRGEPVLRRLVLLGMGLLVGTLGYVVDSQLRVDLPWAMNLRMPQVDGYRYTLFSAEGAPLLKAYLAYFGFLFLILRWWRQADPLRSVRLGLWTTVVCIFWAWLLGAVSPFPQPWGVMVAATIAIAVQVSSPWFDVRRLRQAGQRTA